MSFNQRHLLDLESVSKDEILTILEHTKVFLADGTIHKVNSASKVLLDKHLSDLARGGTLAISFAEAK